MHNNPRVDNTISIIRLIIYLLLILYFSPKRVYAYTNFLLSKPSLPFCSLCPHFPYSCFTAYKIPKAESFMKRSITIGGKICSETKSNVRQILRIGFRIKLGGFTKLILLHFGVQDSRPSPRIKKTMLKSNYRK